jgi:hypothetical protein
MRIYAERGRDGSVAEHGADDVWGDAVLEGECRRRVPISAPATGLSRRLHARR